MKLSTLAAIGLIALFCTVAGAETATLINPTKTASGEQVARLMIDVPHSAKTGDYLLDWPGLDKLLARPGDKNAPKLGSFDGFDFYSSWMNPTSMLRGYGRNLMREPGRQGHLGDLTRAQVFLDWPSRSFARTSTTRSRCPAGRGKNVPAMWPMPCTRGNRWPNSARSISASTRPVDPAIRRAYHF